MDDIRQQSVMSGFFLGNPARERLEIAAAIEHELIRQQDQIEMIASENIVSVAVMEAQGSVFTNKYAEGYSGRRYYGGCEYMDVVETLAIERAKQLFNCNYAKCSAAFRCAGQSGRVPVTAEAGRHHSWYVAGRGGHLTSWGCAEPVW